MGRIEGIREICFNCSHWQPCDERGKVKRDEALKQNSVVAVEGSCVAIYDRGARVLNKSTGQYIVPLDPNDTKYLDKCNVIKREGGILGIGGRLEPAFEANPLTVRRRNQIFPPIP